MTVPGSNSLFDTIIQYFFFHPYYLKHSSFTIYPHVNVCLLDFLQLHMHAPIISYQIRYAYIQEGLQDY